MLQSYGKNQISLVPSVLYSYFFVVICFYLFCKHLLVSQVIFQPIKELNFDRKKVFQTSQRFELLSIFNSCPEGRHFVNNENSGER